MRSRLFESLILPIVVGIVLLIVQGVNEYIKERKDLSIVVEGPLDFLTINKLIDSSYANLSLVFSTRATFEPPSETKPFSSDNRLPAPAITAIEARFEVNVNDLRIYRVVLKNSGNMPLKDVPLRLIFGAGDDFQILSVDHKTLPEHEFGVIEDDFSNKSQPRFKYSLLNPKDEDAIILLVNQPATLDAVVKTEGITKHTSRPDNRRFLSPATVGVIAIASAFIAMLLQTLLLKMRCQKQCESVGKLEDCTIKPDTDVSL